MGTEALYQCRDVFKFSVGSIRWDIEFFDMMTFCESNSERRQELGYSKRMPDSGGVGCCGALQHAALTNNPC